MFKAISNAIYRTPWWAMALGGLCVLLLLALFTVPINVIRLADSGKTRAENQAIQREIDYTFGDSALGLAERVVGAMGERTSDPARKAELEQALKDIAEARKDMSNAEREAARATTDATREAARESRRAAKEAANAARTAARDAAIAARDAAKERIDELRTARKEAVELQSRVGLKDAAALESYDKAIRAAEESERTANDALKQLKAKPGSVSFGVGPDGINVMEKSASDTGSHPPVDAPPAPSSPSKGANAPPTPAPPKAAASPAADPDKLNFDVGTKDKRVRGSITIGDGDKPVLKIDAPDEMKPPVAPLPPDLREDIRRKVAGDFRRVGIGSALIVTFIPLFMVLLIAKFYIGRSRRALEVASVKTKEAESANVNRQIVEAKLMALQAQVEPHFLYNTLANVQALTEVDPQQANQMTGHLIQYLRASLPKMRENISTVGQEIELVRAYLNILKMRMGARLDFGIDVPEELLALPFPPLMLPSLVENAIKHGLEPQREGGRIDVVAERVGQGDDAMIRLMVKDTGRGFSDAPTQAGGGVGLTNIRERLLALFNGRAKLTLEANTPKGVVATIETPAKGATMFSAATADAAAQPEALPKTWRGKTLRFAARTHSFWANLLVKAFVVIVSLLGVLFIIGMIGLATGSLPMSIGGTRITGVEGMALGTLALLLAFGALSIAALVIVAVIYGLGFLIFAIAIGVPILVLLSLFPALLPVAIVGFLLYWFWWRKRSKSIVISPPSP